MTPAFLAVVHNHPTSSATGEIPEAAEPGGCSACARTEEKVDRLTASVETFGRALLRVEAGLGALLSDITALKARMDAGDQQ
jgi:hypothetical protein